MERSGACLALLTHIVEKKTGVTWQTSRCGRATCKASIRTSGASCHVVCRRLVKARSARNASRHYSCRIILISGWALAEGAVLTSEKAAAAAAPIARNDTCLQPVESSCIGLLRCKKIIVTNPSCVAYSTMCILAWTCLALVSQVVRVYSEMTCCAARAILQLVAGHAGTRPKHFVADSLGIARCAHFTPAS